MFSLNDKDHRIAVKRLSERVKLAANALNNAATVTFGAAVVVPAANGSLSLFTAVWILLALVLHFLGQATLGLFRDDG